MKFFTYRNLISKRYLTLLLFIICSIFTVQGQFYSQGRFWKPTPQVSDFIKYTDLSSVDYYTGTINVNIPFYTYKDNDFELPISFSYSSNGYRPNIPAGPVGMGWFLNAGGFITREIRGFKDEAFVGFYKWHQNGDTDYSSINKKGSSSEEQQLPHRDEITGETVYSRPLSVDVGRWRYTNDGIESEPDIFTFNFFGHKGKFNMGPRKVFVYATNHPSGEYLMDLTAFPAKIVIKTGDGYTYTFAKTNPTMGRYGPEYDNTAQLNNPLLYWPLTNIKAPNGREVKFNYTESEKSQRSTPSYYSLGTSENTWQTGISGGAMGDYDYEHESEVKEKQELETEYVVQLKDIQIGDLKIDFTYGPRPKERIYYKRDGFIHNGGPSESMSILNSVTIINTKNSEVVKHADFEYISATGNEYQFLKSIKIDNEDKYEMSYLSMWNFPSHGTTGIDHFGFYNDRSVYEVSDLFPGPIDETKPDWYPARTRESSFQGSVKGMLSELKYPTGGRTKYYYEANDYSAYIKKDRFVLLNETDTTRTPTGGVRIKRITDYSSPIDSTYREFDYSYYDKKDGRSSGAKLHTFRYSENYNLSYEFEFKFQYNRFEQNQPDSTYPPSSQTVTFSRLVKKNIFVHMKNSNGIIPSTRDRSHIEYPEVIERRQDGSCIVYGFLSFKTVPDHNSTSSFNKSLGMILSSSPAYIDDYMTEYNDYSHQRGKPIYIKEYRPDGKPLKETIYKYATSRALATFPTIRPSVRNYYFYNIIVEDYPLIEVVKRDHLSLNPLEERLKLSYNGKKQVVAEETTYENFYETQKWLLNKYQFVSDLPSSEKTAVHTFMEKNNIVNNPIRTQTAAKQTPNASYRIINASRFDYVSKTAGNNNMVHLSKQMETGNNVPADCADFKFDSYLNTKFSYKYNHLGHVIEVMDRANIPSSYLWGYDGLYIVALIENATINRIKTISGFEGVESSVFEEGIPEDNLQAIYNHNANSAITAFYYKPYVGLTKMIAPTQRANYYEYDSAGRLVKMLNEKNEPISEYEYNIINANE